MESPGLSYSSAAGRWVLAVSVLGSGIAALDATVVNIALPVIGLLAAVTITNPARERPGAVTSEPCLHCGLDAPALAVSLPRG